MSTLKKRLDKVEQAANPLAGSRLEVFFHFPDGRVIGPARDEIYPNEQAYFSTLEPGSARIIPFPMQESGTPEDFLEERRNRVPLRDMADYEPGKTALELMEKGCSRAVAMHLERLISELRQQ